MMPKPKRSSQPSESKRSVFRHLGAASTHPCLLCEASEVSLREDTHKSLRSIWSIENGSLSYFFSGGDSLPAKDKDALWRQVCSIAKESLVQVPPSNIVPPSLYLIQGFAQKLIELIKEEQLEKILE
uniref:Uncharacterized protein n=1 Tax=Ditylenchus dipsaci TaxID=166011 RepID=A0A915EHU5_9BILA